MKRLICFAIIIFMLPVCNNYIVSADILDVVFDAQDVISQVEGEGYHSHRGYEFTDNRFTAGKHIILRALDWACYDISGVAAGTYKIEVCMGNINDSVFKVKTDVRTKILKGEIPATGSYLNLQERDLGLVYISNEDLKLVFENISSNSSVYFEYFTLKFIDDEDLVGKLTFMEIKALDIIPGGHGVGFYDSSEEEALETFSNGVILRSAEWCKYDISGFTAGTYKIVFNIANRFATAFNISVDDAIQLTNVIIPETGSYSDYTEAKMGYIELSGNQKMLKIQDSSTNAAYFRSFVMEKLSKIELTAFEGNLGSDNDIIPRGTDSFAVTFNNALDRNYINNNNVILKEKTGEPVGCNLSLDASNKKITILLNETLDYNKEYEIVIQSIKDMDNQTLNNDILIGFVTDGEQNTAGNASVLIEDFSNEGNIVRAAGKMLSDANIGIGGRRVVLMSKSPVAPEAEERVSCITSDGGFFELNYAIADTEKSGKHKIYIGGEYIGSSAVWEGYVYFYNSELDAQISSEMSNLETAQQIESVLNQYNNLIGFDMTDAQSKIPEFDYVYSLLANRKFDSVVAIIDALNTSISLEYINQATSAEDILNILNNEESCLYLNLDLQKWNLLSNDNKVSISEELLRNSRYSGKAELSAELENKINNKLLVQFEIGNPAVIAGSLSIYAGQVAEIDVGFEENQDNVTKIHLDFQYDEKYKEFFGNDNIVFLTHDIKNTTVYVDKKDNAIAVDFIADSLLSGVKDICTISFSAPANFAGIYSLNISGYVSYRPENIGNYFVQANIKTVNSTVNISKIDNKIRYYGSGGGGGGTSYDAKIPASELKIQADDNSDAKGGFKDLNDVEWAKASILELYKKGVINGKNSEEFMPNELITRAEFCKMLVLAFNMLNDKAESDFSDVEKGLWYYTYVASAVESNIIFGKSDGRFYPNDNLTREDMSVIAFRVLELLNVDMPAADAEKFDDFEDISHYAIEQVHTMKKVGIIKGTAENIFEPKGFASRAMAAKVVHMMMEV